MKTALNAKAGAEMISRLLSFCPAQSRFPRIKNRNLLFQVQSEIQRQGVMSEYAGVVLSGEDQGANFGLKSSNNLD
ncbi:MAG: hypothetical protein HY231_06255 [Acidobacteria bacterium]|nr:hypothetical protein [Acidobacteriota bacterium]